MPLAFASVRPPVVLAVAATLVTGVGCRSATGIVVEVYSDLPCETDDGTPLMAGIAVARPGEDPAISATSQHCEPSDRRGLNRLGTVVLSPSGSRDSRVGLAVWMDVLGREPSTCLYEDDTSCVVARRQLRYEPHEELRVLVDLREDCVGAICDETSTCVSQLCVEARIVDPGACSGEGCGEEALDESTGVPPSISRKSLYFSGDYVTCTGIEPITRDTERTVSLWVKSEECPADGFIGLIGREDVGEVFRGWSLELSCSDDAITAFSASLLEDYSTDEYVHVRTGPLSHHVWYHLVATFGGTGLAEDIDLYVDGVSSKRAVAQDSLEGEAANLLAETFIGSVGQEAFHGWIDEVSIWDGVLSQDEIDELYNGGIPGDLAEHSASDRLLDWIRLGEEGVASDVVDAVGVASCTKESGVEDSTVVP